MALTFVRVLLPAALCVAGIAIVVVGIVDGWTETSLEYGIPLFSAGASIWLLNFLFRVGVVGDRERDREDEARQYYAEHGRWPDQERGGRR